MFCAAREKTFRARGKYAQGKEAIMAVGWQKRARGKPCCFFSWQMFFLGRARTDVEPSSGRQPTNRIRVLLYLPLLYLEYLAHVGGRGVDES